MRKVSKRTKSLLTLCLSVWHPLPNILLNNTNLSSSPHPQDSETFFTMYNWQNKANRSPLYSEPSGPDRTAHRQTHAGKRQTGSRGRAPSRPKPGWAAPALRYKYRKLKSGTAATAEQILRRSGREEQGPEQLYPYMVAERGPPVKAQLSHTHALCSHAPDKKQRQHRLLLEERFEILFQPRNLPIISVTYTSRIPLPRETEKTLWAL